MRIAITSQNFRTVTGHAGHARRFIVYQADGIEPPSEVARMDLDADMAIHGFAPGAGHPLDSMDVLITGSAGQGFVRHLAARGVLVVATPETDPRRAVEAFLAGRVLSPACGERDHEHAHGHDQGGEHSCGCQG